MATAILIPVSEYLGTSYQPDRDYIDGEIRERNVGKWEHARVQWLLARWFGNHESEWEITGGTEQRIQVAPTRIRIADLAVLTPGPQPDILTEPPLLVIEILSPDDTYSELQERCQDYLTMGVENVWIIDPKTRTGRMCFATKWVSADRLEIPDSAIYVDLAILFGQIATQAR